MTLDDSFGALGATGVGVSGAGGHTLTISGTLAQVNDALGTVTDQLGLISGVETITLNADRQPRRDGGHANRRPVPMIPTTSGTPPSAAIGRRTTIGASNSPPGAGGYANISATGASYVVTVSTAVSVANLVSVADATIDVTTGFADAFRQWRQRDLGNAGERGNRQCGEWDARPFRRRARQFQI